jgi:lysophospholipase L1-like esterase
LLLRKFRTRRRWSARAVTAGGSGLAAALGAVVLTACAPVGAHPTPTPTRGAASAADQHAAKPTYYLALGDSLSRGVQPATAPLPAGDTLGESIATDQGYADDIEAHYAPAFHGTLRLEKLGCPGETTTSMLTGAGSPCSYPQGSQLAAAVAFLKAHRGEVGLVTLDIGANNVDGCVSDGTISATCVADGVADAQHDLPLILSALRQADGPHTLIVGMNLYDPFLADYLAGTTTGGTTAGETAATESVTLAEQFNRLIASADAAYGARTADVQDAFSTADFTDTADLAGFGSVPLNVDRICAWTWVCAPAPVGPNIHANATGYQVIAAAFERAIGSRL